MKSAPKKKRTPKKRRPKVKLDSKKVMALAAIMIFVCAIVLSVAFIISTPASGTSRPKEKVAVEKQKRTNEKKRTEINRSEKKQNGVAAKVEKSAVEKEKDSAKKKTEAQKETKPAQKTEKKKQAETKTKVAAKKEIKAEQKIAGAETKKQPKVQPKAENKPAEKKSAFSIPQAKNNARLCFIIDDGGQSTANIRKYTALPFPIAVAVLPKLRFTKECARIVVADKKELMLHQPMQAMNLKMNPGPGAVLPDMDLREVYATVSRNLAELGPNVRGFNNHEGSMITADLNMMGAVLDAAVDNNVYFVDSRTTKDTMASFAALERDMKILEREVFIDDVIDRGEMLRQILRGIDLANKKGKVIMIGHVDKSAKILPVLLSEMYPELKAKGYRLVFPSQLL